MNVDRGFPEKHVICFLFAVENHAAIFNEVIQVLFTIANFRTGFFGHGILIDTVKFHKSIWNGIISHFSFFNGNMS